LNNIFNCGDEVALSSYITVGRVWVGPSTDGGDGVAVSMHCDTVKLTSLPVSLALKIIFYAIKMILYSASKSVIYTVNSPWHGYKHTSNNISFVIN